MNKIVKLTVGTTIIGMTAGLAGHLHLATTQAQAQSSAPKTVGINFSEIEVESGDPDLARRGDYEQLSADQNARSVIASLAIGPVAKGAKILPPGRLAKAMLKIAESEAKAHVSRKSNPARVKAYLALFGLPMKYPNGDYVPFCAAGVGYCASKAYCQLEGINFNRLGRAACRDLQKFHFFPHPGTEFMVSDAKKLYEKRRPLSPNWVKHSKKDWLTVKPGWLVFYNWGKPLSRKRPGVPEHVGIVRKATRYGLDAVEFNTTDLDLSNGGAVALKPASKRLYKYVLGYIRTW